MKQNGNITLAATQILPQDCDRSDSKYGIGREIAIDELGSMTRAPPTKIGEEAGNHDDNRETLKTP